MINVVTQDQDDQEDHKDYEHLVAHAVLLRGKPSWRAVRWFLIFPAVTYMDDTFNYI
jgi:hypothetical protein